MAIIFGSVLYDLLILLATCITAVYLYMTRNFGYWKKRHIPYLKPKPIVGNLGDLFKMQYGMGHYLEKIYNKFPNEPYFGIYALDTPLLVVKDVYLIKNIMVKDANTFIDRNFSPAEEIDPLSSKMLFGVKGDKWKHLRIKLTPTFTSGKMKKMFYLVDKFGKNLAEYLGESSKSGQPIHVKEAMARYSTDVIASCAFGVEANALKDANSEFRKMARKIFEFDLRRYIMLSLSFFMPRFVQFFKQRVFEKSVDDFVRTTLWDVVAYREKTGEVRNDFVDLLMQMKKDGENQAGSRKEFEGDDFVAQAFVFLAAGFETSSTTLTFCLYSLALNPDVQTKLRREILSVLAKHDGKFSYDAMMEMTYMDMVVSETLRMYPPVTILERKCQRNYTIPGTNDIIEKDVGVFISLLGLHYDPKYFPDPKKFIPERFSAENKNNRTDYTFMPFGEGPRNCIGMRFGQMQMKTALTYILKEYEIQRSKLTQDHMEYTVYALTLAPLDEVPLLFNRLQ